MSTPPLSRFITVAQAAAELQVSRWSIYRLIWDGKVTSVQIGRCRRIVRDAFDAYCAALVEEAA